MEEKNEPVLFVNTFTAYKTPIKEKVKVKLHRLDDIEVLLKLNKIIEVSVNFSDNILNGIVKSIIDNSLILTIDTKDITINLDNIKSISIISTK